MRLLAFRAKAPIKGFNECIVGRLARPGEVERDTVGAGHMSRSGGKNAQYQHNCLRRTIVGNLRSPDSAPEVLDIYFHVRRYLAIPAPGCLYHYDQHVKREPTRLF